MTISSKLIRIPCALQLTSDKLRVSFMSYLCTSYHIRLNTAKGFISVFLVFLRLFCLSDHLFLQTDILYLPCPSVRPSVRLSVNVTLPYHPIYNITIITIMTNILYLPCPSVRPSVRLSVNVTLPYLIMPFEQKDRYKVIFF